MDGFQQKLCNNNIKALYITLLRRPLSMIVQTVLFIGIVHMGCIFMLMLTDHKVYVGNAIVSAIITPYTRWGTGMWPSGRVECAHIRLWQKNGGWECECASREKICGGLPLKDMWRVGESHKKICPGEGNKNSMNGVSEKIKTCAKGSTKCFPPPPLGSQME